MGDKKFWLWLSSIPGIGSIRFFALLKYFGSAENVFGCSEKELRAAGILPEEAIKNITDNRKIDKIDKYFKKVKDNDIKVYTILENEYPENLKNIYDAPPVIYVKGELKAEDNKAVGIVGSRKASEYGLKMAEKLASQLAESGVTVISGMAVGIDSAAHRGALKSGGRTVAVFGCGLNHVYPRSGTNLYNEIIKNGAVITEYPLGMNALPKNFVARNRIISGMSLGVVVVEAGEKSGSLITSDFAMEQGREVFAVPGNINSFNSKGTNSLIKDGAKLVASAEDILEELDIEIKHGNICSNRQEYSFSTVELAITSALKTAGKSMSDIISESGYPAGRIMSALTILELNGIIQSCSGLYYLEE